MKDIKIKPYAIFLKKKELVLFLPKELRESIKKKDDEDLFGIVIDIKAFDPISNRDYKLFMEYAFGRKRKSKHLKEK